MTWFKVDDGLWGHPKVAGVVSLSAIGLWTMAGSWCSRYLTDGRVPSARVKVLGGTKKQAMELVSAGLWLEVDDGFQFHDWSDYQGTKTEAEERRGLDARRKALSRDREKRAFVFSRDGFCCVYCKSPVTGEDGHLDHVTPISRGGSDLPENLATCCKVCNSSKSAMTPVEWVASRKNIAVLRNVRADSAKTPSNVQVLSSPLLSLPNPSQPNLKASALPHEPDLSGEKPSKRDERKLLFAATWKAEAKALGYESTPDCPATQRDKVIRMATEAADATGRSFADCLKARIVGGLEASVRLGKAPKWAVVDWDPKAASKGPQAVKDAGERYADLKAALSRLEGNLTHAKVFGTPQQEREIAERMSEIRAQMRTVREAG